MMYHLQLFPEGFCDYATPHLIRYLFQSETCNLFIWLTAQGYELDSFQTELSTYYYLHYKHGIGLKSGIRIDTPLSGALAITNHSLDDMIKVTQHLELERFPDLQKKIFDIAGGSSSIDRFLVDEERSMLVNGRMSDSSHQRK
jgi:hypothetical protein